VTRLCIDEQIRSRAVLVRLFNYLFIHAVCTRERTDCVIEVNPRHVNYYQRLLSFDQLGLQRPCARVKGAPAVLLHLRREVYEREVQRCRNAAVGVAVSDRSLYRHFLNACDEANAAAVMSRQSRSMGFIEASRFGLTPPFNRALSDEQVVSHSLAHS
jgi:hypothetical protein